MPLIRYQIGDEALLARGTCGCGRCGPRLQRVTGRKLPPFVNAAGEYVESFSLVEQIRESPHVREFQLIQEDARHLRLLLAPAPTCTAEYLAELEAGVLAVMGPECELAVERVESVPLPPSGKRQMLVNKIKDEG